MTLCMDCKHPLGTCRCCDGIDIGAENIRKQVDVMILDELRKQAYSQGVGPDRMSGLSTAAASRTRPAAPQDKGAKDG